MRASGITERRLAAAGAVLMCTLSGCEMPDTVAPQFETRAVVHAVLNPASGQQIVIVERTLTSITRNNDGSPVRQPITNARVVIYGPREDSVIATPSANATDGIYRVQSVTIADGSAGTAPPNVLRLRPGERFRLKVETPFGVTRGEATIPVGGTIDNVRRTFNLDRDTLRLNVGAVRNAAGFMLRHEIRTNTEERFVTRVDDPLVFPLAQAQGDPDVVSWSFSFSRGLMFPGFAQNFVVVAVDSNYFRYYVAGFDPFGDDTRGNTLTGGVGLFGAVAPVMSKVLDLTADIDTPIEGAWFPDRTPATLPASMTLYSSPYFPNARYDGRTQISGTGRSVTGRQLEVYASIQTNEPFFELYDPSGSAQAVIAGGVLSTDTLVLIEQRTGERVTYRKR